MLARVRLAPLSLRRAAPGASGGARGAPRPHSLTHMAPFPLAPRARAPPLAPLADGGRRGAARHCTAAPAGRLQPLCGARGGGGARGGARGVSGGRHAPVVWRGGRRSGRQGRRAGGAGVLPGAGHARAHARATRARDAAPARAAAPPDVRQGRKGGGEEGGGIGMALEKWSEAPSTALHQSSRLRLHLVRAFEGGAAAASAPSAATS